MGQDHSTGTAHPIDGDYREYKEPTSPRKPARPGSNGATAETATTPFSITLDGDGLLYPTRADRLPMLGLDARPVKFEPFPPCDYPIMRLADGQSFPIREFPIMKGPTVRVNVPDHGYRIITTSNIVCIDLP